MTNIAAPVTSAVTGNVSAAKSSGATLADNFQTFLTLLTAQLQNQNPLDPLDTNQFTQQLVQFAQVEQQLKSNDQLATLVALQQTVQTTQVLGFVGQSVAIDGATARLANGNAVWSLTTQKPATATVNIQNAAGANVYSGSFAMQAGTQNFVWDGRGTNGTMQPDGAYTISVTAADAGGQNIAVATEVQGIVDSVDVSKTPPMLSIGGRDYAVDKIRRVINPASTQAR